MDRTSLNNVQKHNFTILLGDLDDTGSCLWGKYSLFFLLPPSLCSARSSSGQIASLVAEVTADKHAADEHLQTGAVRRLDDGG